MPAQAMRIGRRFLVWIVAAVSSAESLLQASVGLLNRRPGEVVIWMVGAVAIYGIAAFLEKVKLFEEE